MLHRMKLQPEPFRKIASGEKTFELRLYDEKRRALSPGDNIEFSDISCPERRIMTEITALYPFENFSRLWDELPREKLGIASPEEMELYYSAGEQEKYGVIAIEIKVEEKTDKRKVLICASNRRHIMNFHLPYIAAFRERGWHVTVACRSEGEPIPGADEVLDIAFEKKMTSLKNFRASLMLRKIISQRGYDLMVCHTSLAAFFSRIALFALPGRPAVCNMVHGYLFDDESSALKKLVMSSAEKLCAPVTELVITMNSWDDAYARRKDFAKDFAFVKGIGMDEKNCPGISAEERETMRRELGLAEEDFLLIYAAEFSGRKSQSTLIKALALLPENVKLMLPGDGALLEECKALAQSLGLEERLVFPGHLSNVKAWYQCADAAVSSSRSEGLPFNILEAMHYGLPVVASRVKGHTDLIEDGINGLLFEYGDSRAAAEQVQKIMAEPSLRARFTEFSRNKVREYYLDALMPDVLDKYFHTNEIKVYR